jgi:hypothetical protein
METMTIKSTSKSSGSNFGFIVSHYPDGKEFRDEVRFSTELEMETKMKHINKAEELGFSAHADQIAFYLKRKMSLLIMQRSGKRKHE